MSIIIITLFFSSFIAVAAWCTTCLSLSDSTLPRLTYTKAAAAFINSAEVVVIGFLEVRGENWIVREMSEPRTQISLETSFKYAHNSCFITKFITQTCMWQTTHNETN